MVSKDQGIGWLIFIICAITAISYSIALFIPALESTRFWLIATPVLIAFVAILAIGAWIGWTMATTPPPKPIEEIQNEE
jgi:predicted DNA-binding transcriptional regulator